MLPENQFFGREVPILGLQNSNGPKKRLARLLWEMGRMMAGKKQDLWIFFNSVRKMLIGSKMHFEDD